MATNSYFTHNTSVAERALVDAMVVESIQIAGLDIKYIPRNNVNNFKIYPIYSIQIPKGNYMIDEFIEEIQGILNNVSKKIYDYNAKLFIENTKYKIKTI